MNKAQYIKRFGETAWAKKRQTKREWDQLHPDKIRAKAMERIRKGGKHYERKLAYEHTGLQGRRNRVRVKHGTQWRSYKRIIAPDSQLHHQWAPHSALYDGLALVETDQHMHGFIDVIKILEGNITLYSEKEIANRGEI